ncbi:MAG: TIGR03943 family protein [Actinomycetota bacterium]
MTMRPRDPGALITAAVLAVWAAALWFLELSDRWALLLSTRTRWVLVVGAVILTAGALGRLATAGARRSAGALGRRHVLGLAFVALPAVVVLALPPTTLGAAAASSRGAAGGAYVSGLSISTTGPPTLIEVAAARYSPDVLHALGRKAGERVSYVGFVKRDPDTPSDQFLLTRFVITCCVADALVAEVRVVGLQEQGLHENQWVRVSGRLFPVRDDILLLADRVQRIDKPAHPYLTP